MLTLCVLDEGTTTGSTRRGSSRYKFPVSDCFVFLGSIIFCRLYKSPLSDQAKVILQLTVGLSDLV